MFLSFLVWPLLPTHCRVLLLHLITLKDTHTLSLSLSLSLSFSVSVSASLGRTSLDKGSARRRDFALQQTTFTRETFMPPEELEPAVPASERQQP